MSHHQRRYTFDIEAVVFQSQFNDAPPRDPLQAALILADIVANPKFDRERSACWKCKAFDRGERRPATFDRPAGVNNLESCDGCVLSHLDIGEESVANRRDRLYNEWAACRAEMDRWDEAVKAAQVPADKKLANEYRKRALRAITTAKKACALAGFDPAKRRRQSVRHEGDIPQAALAHHVVSQEFGRDGLPKR